MSQALLGICDHRAPPGGGFCNLRTVQALTVPLSAFGQTTSYLSVHALNIWQVTCPVKLSNNAEFKMPVVTEIPDLIHEEVNGVLC